MKRLGLVMAMTLVLAGTAARADEKVGIGLFAPSAPFDGPVARLDFVTALAGRVGPGYTGHAYAKATDFVAAVKRGEIKFAVVDAPFVAALGTPYTVLAAAERGGATGASWEVVTGLPAKSLLELHGKTIAVPAVGAREEAFLLQVLLEGELPKDHFSKIVYTPDSLSALAAVEHGRADAAVVPAGLAAPAGTHRVASLSPIQWPVLVALPGAPGADAVTSAALGMAGGKVFDRFVRASGDSLRELATRFVRAEKHPPLLVPALRLSASGLLGGTTYEITRPDPLSYIGARR